MNATEARHAPAYRAWHCGTCDTELVAFGNDGDLTCEVCGFIYRPDGADTAPCVRNPA